MIRYHGGPITPNQSAVAGWFGGHAFVSFAYPRQLPLAADICQSFGIDNGAYTHWKRGRGQIDVPAYVEFVNTWKRHPGFDWCVIPDVIDGDEAANDGMFSRFRDAGGDLLGSVPVWHLHESIDRFARLCHTFPRVALGTSGDYKLKTTPWYQRMDEALEAICDDQGRPCCKLHGLRMMDPTIFSIYPFASVDSNEPRAEHRDRQRVEGATGRGPRLRCAMGERSVGRGGEVQPRAR